MGLFFKTWVTEVLVCSFKEVFHHVGATEDCPLVDGEVVVSPCISSSLVEEGERHVDFAQGLNVVDVLDKVVTEGLTALFASIIPVWRVDLVGDAHIDLCGGLLCSRLSSGCGWYRVGCTIDCDLCSIPPPWQQLRPRCTSFPTQLILHSTTGAGSVVGPQSNHHPVQAR